MARDEFMARHPRTTRRADLKSSRPPVLAAWLFEYLTQHEHHEALAQDLLEEYIRRRSDMWYWRQGVAAILADFSGHRRCEAILHLDGCQSFAGIQPRLRLRVSTERTRQHLCIGNRSLHIPERADHWLLLDVVLRSREECRHRQENSFAGRSPRTSDTAPTTRNEMNL